MGGADTEKHVVQIESVDASEAHQLEEMGYKQELNRNLGMVAILGLSFAIMVRRRRARYLY